MTDDYDKRLLNTFAKVWFSDDMFLDDFQFYKGYKIIKFKNISDYLESFDTMNTTDPPQAYGLHPNADITCVLVHFFKKHTSPDSVFVSGIKRIRQVICFSRLCLSNPKNLVATKGKRAKQSFSDKSWTCSPNCHPITIRTKLKKGICSVFMS